MTIWPDSFGNSKRQPVSRSAKDAAPIGVIGGSGLYDIEGFTDRREVRVATPFGDPSDAYQVGRLDGTPVAFLPRHGQGHRVSPTEVNSRANIFGFKTLGVERVISVSAVGSMREHIAPLDVVIPDQLIDRTRLRPLTFFGRGIVVHVGFADPFCPELSGMVADAAEATGTRVHRGGTYICIEGPRFSTRAESRAFRQWGADVIGMTAIPEAILAREAELCYAALAMVTDFDVWHESEAPVTVDMVVANLVRNVATARAALRGALPRAAAARQCDCGSALAGAIMTAPDRVPARIREDLRPLIGRYLT